MCEFCRYVRGKSTLQECMMAKKVPYLASMVYEDLRWSEAYWRLRQHLRRICKSLKMSRKLFQMLRQEQNNTMFDLTFVILAVCESGIACEFWGGYQGLPDFLLHMCCWLLRIPTLVQLLVGLLQTIFDTFLVIQGQPFNCKSSMFKSLQTKISHLQNPENVSLHSSNS